MIVDFFSIAITNLKRRRIRSWLTIIGIVIGIMLIIILVSLGEGVNNFVAEQFEKLGANKVVVFSGISSAALTEKDVKAVSRINGVKYAFGALIKIGFATHKSETQPINIMGIETNKETLKAFLGTTPIELDKGRFLKPGEDKSIVIGWKVAHERFNKELEIGDYLQIKNKKFRIVGVAKKTGLFMIDDVGIISLHDMKNLFKTRESYSRIFIQARKGKDLEELGDEIKRKLREERNLKKGEEDFTIESAQDIAKSFSNVMTSLQWFLIGIASISLIVGIIGIMNTMYMAVIERKKEIGIMKAIGARNSHISLIFLLEAGIMGLVGGVIGISLGVLLSVGISYFISLHFLQNFTPLFPLYLIIGTLSLSFLMGIVGGTWPAYLASKHKPTKTLREE